MYGVHMVAGRRISVIGISVAALTHNLTHCLMVAALFLKQAGVLFYLPYLMLFAVPTGIFVGLLGMRAIRILS